MFMESDNHTAEFYSGWLIITDNATRQTYPVQMRDTETGRNITRKQFNDAVKGYGLDRACQTFRKLYARPSTQCYG